MKTVIIKITLLLIVLNLNYSCQEVVEVDLETAQERLVIEALIKWETGSDGAHQTIKLSKTSSFYNDTFLPAIGATVSIRNEATLQEFVFTDTNNGIYETTNFVPVLNDNYRLEVSYNNETYIAETELLASPAIIDITQSFLDGFSSEDPEVNVSFQDFIDQEDFYRIKFYHFRPSLNELINDDTFNYDSSFEENNIITDWYESEDIIVGDEFKIEVSKISSQYYTFLEVLEGQADAGIGPFASPPVNVKGNCSNLSNPSHYPYGYFGLNEISVGLYTYQ